MIVRNNIKKYNQAIIIHTIIVNVPFYCTRVKNEKRT